MSDWTYPLWNDGQTDYVYKVTPQRDLQLTFVPHNKKSMTRHRCTLCCPAAAGTWRSAWV